MTVQSNPTELDGLQQDVESILTDVLSSILREEVLPAFDSAPAGEQAITRLAIHDLDLDRYVAVEVRVPIALAQVLAGRMLAVAQPMEDDVIDAVAELGNIAGGNVKAVLFRHSRLSLPAPRFEISPAERSRHPEGLIARAGVGGQICELEVSPVADAEGLQWPPHGDLDDEHGSVQNEAGTKNAHQVTDVESAL